MSIQKMKIQYVKRLQMERQLDFILPEPELPPGFLWLPWKSQWTDVHGRVIYQGFVHDLDGSIFPTFRKYASCLHLMRSVASSPDFLPKGTWLVAIKKPEAPEKYEFCGTIQGLRRQKTVAAIQNLAVRPEFRRIGLARLLMIKAMNGFRASGCRRVRLDVTALNHPAVKLYESLGFETVRSSFREMFLEESEE